jgi:uncharacterized membrane protein YfcA
VTPYLVAVAAAVALGAAAQVSVGFGFALLVVPVLTAVAGAKVAVVTMTAIGLPMTLANAIRWRRNLLGREALRVSLASLVGMPFGALLLTRTGEEVLAVLVGIVVLVLTAWLWHGLTLPAGRTTEVAAGVASGALATSVGTNGPPLVIAFQATGMPPPAFRATLAVTFFVEGSIALATFWRAGLVTAQIGRGWMVGVPAVVAGTMLGERVFARLGTGRFRAAVLATLAISGALAIASAILN